MPYEIAAITRRGRFAVDPQVHARRISRNVVEYTLEDRPASARSTRPARDYVAERRALLETLNETEAVLARAAKRNAPIYAAAAEAAHTRAEALVGSFIKQEQAKRAQAEREARARSQAWLLAHGHQYAL